MRLYGIRQTFDTTVEIISEEVEKETPKTYILKNRLDVEHYPRRIYKNDMSYVSLTPQEAIKKHIKRCQDKINQLEYDLKRAREKLANAIEVLDEMAR